MFLLCKLLQVALIFFFDFFFFSAFFPDFFFFYEDFPLPESVCIIQQEAWSVLHGLLCSLFPSK